MRERTFVAEDVKSILKGMEEILHLYREIFHLMATVENVTIEGLGDQEGLLKDMNKFAFDKGPDE